MTTLLTLLLKLQLNLTATGSLLFMMAFQEINEQFEDQGLEPQLDAKKLEFQQALPAEEDKPAVPAEEDGE